MCPMRCLFAIALPFFMFDLLPRAPHSTRQPGTLVEIHGRVFYSNGKVAAGAIVVAYREDRFSGRIPSGNSDNEGRFVIKRLESGVRYDICASKQYDGHFDPYFLPFGLSTGGQCGKITAGGVSEVDVVLAPRGGIVEGLARDARNQNPISNGKVVVYRPLKFLRGQWVLVNPGEATWVPTAEANLEENGHFKISGLPTGTYFLKIEIQGRRDWYFNDQLSEAAAQPIFIQSGVIRKIVVSIH
jgi:hypothetical protein